MIVFIASSVILLYGRYQQRPVTIPAREAPHPPAIRPRSPGNYIKVLSLDGSGIRMLPALHCLANLEERAGKPVSQMFDVIVGTSSGGLIAAALTALAEDGTPLFTAKHLLETYPKVMQRMHAAPLIHPLLSLEGRSAPRYLTRERHRVLLELFGKTSQLGDALTTVILPAYAVDLHTPFFFASDMGKSTVPGDGPRRSATEAGDYFLADALTASTGDPALFAPSRITNTGHEQSFTFISAQIYAANPTLIAVGETLLRFPGKQCVVISLGAGTPEDDAFSPHTAWTLNSAENLIDAAATGNAATTSQITSLLHRFGSG
jgi:patatin-like phospholipase/acyl hydrolase